MHALKSNGCGLVGGRKIVSALRQKTGLTATALFEMEALKPKAHMVEGSDAESDYLVKHCTRHFIIAADSLNAFDDNVTLRDAMKYLPDQTSQTGGLHDLTFARIKKEIGCDPIFLSCHLCFAQKFTDPN